MSPFYQGRIRDWNIARGLKCPFCDKQQVAISDRRKHMRECASNPKKNLEGVKVGA